MQETLQKTFLFYNCNSRALHSTDCINSFDKEHNRQFYCQVGKEVSLVSSQAQLKRHHIVKQNIFSSVLPGRYICLMFLLHPILLNNADYQFSVSALLTLLWKYCNSVCVCVCVCVCVRVRVRVSFFVRATLNCFNLAHIFGKAQILRKLKRCCK